MLNQYFKNIEPDIIFIFSGSSGRWRRADRDVEIMGGLRVADQLGWSDVRPATRVAIALGGETRFVPARDEMIAILARFGRDKDRERALILARCTGAPG